MEEKGFLACAMQPTSMIPGDCANTSGERAPTISNGQIIMKRATPPYEYQLFWLYRERLALAG